MENLQNNNRIVKNTVALYVRMAITMVVSFLTVRITLQLLGSEDYGLNNLVGSIVSLMSFISVSMGTSVQRFFSYEIGRENKERLKKIFGVGMYLHICIAVLTFVVTEIFAIFFLNKLNIPQERLFAAHVVFQISVVSLILGVVTIPYGSLLRAREEFTKFATLDILQSLGRLVVLYLLYITPYDRLISLSFLNLVITVLYVGGQVFYAKRYEESKFHIDTDKILIKEMLSFISFLLFTVLFSILRDKGIVVLVNMFFSLIVNAAYAIASQMMFFANTFAMNFKQALVPQMMSAYGAGDYKRMNEIIIIGTKITSVMLLLITLPIIFEPRYFLDIILKDVPELAPEFTRLVMININVASFTYFLYQGVHATGNIKGQQVYMSILYALNVLLIYVVYKLGGESVSALYVTIVCSFLQCIINLLYAHKTFDFDVRYFMTNVVARFFLLSLAFVLIPFSISSLEETLFRFVLRTVIIVLIVLAGSFLYFDYRERLYIAKLMNSLVKKFKK